MKFTKPILALALAGCSPSDAADDANTSVDSSTISAKQIQTEIEALKLAQNSPDVALTSFYKLRNREVELECQISPSFNDINEKLRGPIRTRYQGMFTNEALEVYSKSLQPTSVEDCLKEKQVLSLDIKNVDVQSPTRAIILAQVTNSSAIPSGAEPDENMQKWRKQGETYRYIMTNDAGSWKVSQIYTKPMFSDDEDDWTATFNPKEPPSIPAFVTAY